MTTTGPKIKCFLTYDQLTSGRTPDPLSVRSQQLGNLSQASISGSQSSHDLFSATSSSFPTPFPRSFCLLLHDRARIRLNQYLTYKRRLLCMVRTSGQRHRSNKRNVIKSGHTHDHAWGVVVAPINIQQICLVFRKLEWKKQGHMGRKETKNPNWRLKCTKSNRHDADRQSNDCTCETETEKKRLDLWKHWEVTNGPFSTEGKKSERPQLVWGRREEGDREKLKLWDRGVWLEMGEEDATQLF